MTAHRRRRSYRELSTSTLEEGKALKNRRRRTRSRRAKEGNARIDLAAIERSLQSLDQRGLVQILVDKAEAAERRYVAAVLLGMGVETASWQSGCRLEYAKVTYAGRSVEILSP